MTGEAGDAGRIRTYRQLGLMIFLALVCAVFGGLFALFGVLLVTAGDVHVAVAFPFCAIASVLFVVAFAAVRSSTVVDGEGIAVRWLRTRRMAWRDIIAVEVEEDMAAARERGRPVLLVVVYLRDGRRTALPNVVDGRRLTAPGEAHVIREAWERRRGEDWTPRPAVAAAAREKAGASERAQNSVVEAMGCGLTAVRALVLGVVVVAVIFLATGNAGAVPDIPGEVFAGVFAAVFLAPVAIALAGTVRRRSRRDDEAAAPDPGRDPEG